MIDDLIFSLDNKQLFIKCSYKTNNYLTFWIKVRSGEFSGASEFCISKEKLKEIIEILTKMHNKLKGNCEIKDYDSDAYIIIGILDNLGHVDIYGQIGGSHQDQYMKFKYIADQTILGNLIQIFKNSLEK